MPDNALKLALVSKAAYLDQTPGVVRIECKATDTVALLDYQRDYTVVAFCGTRDLRNWWTNLDVDLVTRPSGAGDFSQIKIHRGFTTALDAIWLQLRDEIKAAGKPVWITGHSLGGALAMEAALRIGFYVPVLGVYTFGQPRVGNKAFAQFYDAGYKSKTFRVVHAQDIVARLPWLLGSYRHAGHEIFYTDFRPFAFMVDMPWIVKFPYDVRGILRAETSRLGWASLALGFEKVIKDHSMDRYLTLFQPN
jgi:triacylglycerol lipase